MDISGQRLLTVKDWAKLSKLKLLDYTGFIDVYQKLSYDDLGKIHDYAKVRFESAGDLICTRQAFENYIFNCAIVIPGLEELKQMVLVIPDFVESEIRTSIASIIGSLKHLELSDEERKKEIIRLEGLLKLYIVAREKSIELNGIKESQPLEGIKEFQEYKNYETVEILENEILTRLITNTSYMTSFNDYREDAIPYDDLKLLTDLARHSKRMQAMDNAREQFIYLSTISKQPQTFSKKYNLISSDGIQSNVVFKSDSLTSTVGGVLPILNDDELDEINNSR